MIYQWGDVPDRDDLPGEPAACFCCSGCGGFVYKGEEYFAIEYGGKELRFCQDCLVQRTADEEE